MNSPRSVRSVLEGVRSQFHNRRLLLLILVLASLLVGLLHRYDSAPRMIDAPPSPSRGPGADAPPRLNLILISIDSLRADHVGLYGYPRATTPSIDAWARGGVHMKDYYAAAYLTPITEATVHTGLYPRVNGLMNFQTLLRPDVPTLAERLKRDGYRTAGIGSSPEFRTHDALRESFRRGFDVFRMGGRGLFSWRSVFDWMEQGEKPFFLWLPIGSVHWPYGWCSDRHFSSTTYHGPLEGVRPEGGGPDRLVLPLELLSHVYRGHLYPFDARSETAIYNMRGLDPPFYPDLAKRPARVLPLGPADMQFVVDRYDDGIRSADAWLGQLFTYLERTGLAGNTVVVIASEHGEDLGEHGYVAHYDILDTTVHTPLIIRSPRLARRGAVSGLMSSVDLMPTMLEMLGLQAPATNGMSFLPCIEGRVPAPRTAVYLTRSPLWERVITTPRAPAFYNSFRTLDDIRPQFDTALRTARWKLIHRRARVAEARYSWYRLLTREGRMRPEFELYDLDADPGEHVDRTGSATITASLRQQLERWEQEMDREAVTLRRVEQKTQPYF